MFILFLTLYLWITKTSPTERSFRASLRNISTSAEAALWEMLKSKKLYGRKFRRQYSIGSYIVDFCCPSEILIIELDGDHHGEYFKIEKDKKEINLLINHPGPALRGHPSFKRRGN